MLRPNLLQTASIIILSALLLAGQASGQYPGPFFSLDDDPSGPVGLSSAGAIPGYGAENPWGLAAGPHLAPSPSLGPSATGPFHDSDILRKSLPAVGLPVMHLALGSATIEYLNAVTGTTVTAGQAGQLRLCFSVDRLTRGQSGPPPSAVRHQFNRNQQPGDVFRTNVGFTHPGSFVGTFPAGPAGYSGDLTTVGAGDTNLLMFDESRLRLTAGLGTGTQIGPMPTAPAITQGSHDNVDAVELRRVNQLQYVFFSVYPDERFLPSALEPWDISVWDSTWNIVSVYAQATAMGLLDVSPGAGLKPDDIDALVLWDMGAGGDRQAKAPQATAAVDYALFSLSPDSGSLSVYGLEASEIFFTQYDGRFWRYASANDLGLMSGVGMENVDALEVVVAGDANADGMVDYQDLGILATNYGKTGMEWDGGDFTGDGRVGYEDLGLLATFYDEGTKSGSPVPGPAALVLLALGGLAVARRRPRRRQ